MEVRGNIFAAAGIIITVQIGLSAWLEAGIAGLTDRVDRVEREVGFVRGQLSLALPAPAGQAESGSKR